MYPYYIHVHVHLSQTCATVRKYMSPCIHVHVPFVLQLHLLKFQFPFYGHLLKHVAVTTGGTHYTRVTCTCTMYMYMYCACTCIVHVT